ncbi:uncharacterized protein LOC126282322 [Schistocerca gregaria]|uniref:uncharacterized protein LOC126282322 n=1 Tax=Schistocerca gregaria TaxID=7010 RepID=UPI00211F177A|nr:uncharacterized protein LOC126282322 [Schistocerca gregaria]
MVQSKDDKIQRGPKSNGPLPVSLARYTLEKLRQHGDAVALVYPELGGRQLTFGELARRSVVAASQLRRLGLRAGDVLAVASLGAPHFTPLFVGGLLVGAVVAPFNPGFDDDEMRHVLGLLKPCVLIADAPNALYEKCAATVVSGADMDEWLEDKAGGDVDVDPPVGAAQLDSPAVVLCSSGTTGHPKGVEISHRALLHLLTVDNEEGMMINAAFGSFLLLSPVFWVSSIMVQLLCLNSGAKIVALLRFDEQLFLKVLREYNVVNTTMPPYLGVKLCKMNPRPDLAPLKFIMFGGSVMDPDSQAEVQSKYNVTVAQVYGMTEMLMTMGCDYTKPTPLGSVGQPRRDVEVKVVDTQTGQSLGPRQEGELCFRGPTVTRGYYDDPAATAAAFDADGWFHTGDIGYYDDDGFFFITDRIKDFIKYKGHHVPSAQLEALLCRHPAVLEAAVVGVPDPLAAELPRAYVVLKPGEPASEDQVAHFVDSQVSDHKKLRGGVFFIDRLPRTAAGKISKKLLIEELKKRESAATTD